MEKIHIQDLSQDDLHYINEAVAKYRQALQQLCISQNTSQQHIHHSILNEFGHELLKKLIKRKTDKKPTLNIEVHAAFVLYDALHHYSHYASNPLEAAVMSRLTIQLFSLLPRTEDYKLLSLHSSLNTEKE